MNIYTASMVVVGNNDNNHVSSSSRANAAPPAELPIERSKSDAELVIQRAIEGIQRMIKPYAGDDDEEATKAVIEINPAMKKHWESEIKILREAPRDEKKLREILKVKQKEYDKAKDREDIERLVPEIEMFKFVLFLVRRDHQE